MPRPRPSRPRPAGPSRAPRGRRRGGAVSGCAVAVGVLLVAACTGSSAQAPAASSSLSSLSSASSRSASPSPTSPARPRPTTAGPRRLVGGPVLAAKIDNTGASRPRVGVGRADVVYVEPVEAGLTRLLVVWSSSMPPQIGPVRSGRETDVDLLANYGRVAFAFSGASAGTLATLSRGHQVDLSNDASGHGFFRAGNRAAPYNVIGDTRALLARAGGSVRPLDPGFRYGAAAAAGGARGDVVRTAWAASRIELRYDAARHRYLVTTDGRADIDADGSQHSAATVVVQHVSATLSANTDVNGVHSPLATVVGRGAVDVLRDGRVWHGTWSRSSSAAPTAFVSDGTTLTMATGPVWVLLVPTGQRVTIG